MKQAFETLEAVELANWDEGALAEIVMPLLQNLAKGRRTVIPGGQIARFVAATASPTLLRRFRSRKGRPGPRGAGERVALMVQTAREAAAARGEPVDERDLVTHARREIADETGLPVASVAQAHRRFLETGKKPELTSLRHGAIGPSEAHDVGRRLVELSYDELFRAASFLALGQG